MLRSLVGSEMCIRDRDTAAVRFDQGAGDGQPKPRAAIVALARFVPAIEAVSYTHLTLPTIYSV